MTVEELIALRKRLGLTQTQMGERIGLSMRGYQDIEGGAAKLRPLHVNAVERVALAIAVETRNPMLAPPAIRAAALDLAQMLRGE